MNDELLKKIEENKEVLSTLPQNNKKNVTKYINTINKLIQEYSALKDQVKAELDNRYNKLSDIKENSNIESTKNNISMFEGGFSLLSTSNTSYEKVKLNNIIYDISKYYKSNLNKVTSDVLNAISIFNNVGIKLTADDFNYSNYLHEFMITFYKCIDDLDSEELKDKFESLYWKCSDILVHLELNLRYLYYKNKKCFDIYCDKCKVKFLNNNKEITVWNKYCELKKEYDTLLRSDLYLIVNKFFNKEFGVNDFAPAKIEAIFKELITVDEINEDTYDDILKFYYSIKEYKDYLDVIYIIDAIKKIYSEKTSYKPAGKQHLASILKLEKKLFSNNKKISYLQKKQKDDTKLVLVNVDLIKRIKELYDQIELVNFKDQLYKKIDDNSTYYDILEIVYANHNYLITLIKEDNDEISDSELEEKTNKVKDILLSPYNTFINNINIISDKDIKMVISDRYKLSNFNITVDMLDDEGALSNFETIINKIMCDYYLKKTSITIENIKFMCEYDNTFN